MLGCCNSEWTRNGSKSRRAIRLHCVVLCILFIRLFYFIYFLLYIFVYIFSFISREHAKGTFILKDINNCVTLERIHQVFDKISPYDS